MMLVSLTQFIAENEDWIRPIEVVGSLVTVVFSLLVFITAQRLKMSMRKRDKQQYSEMTRPGDLEVGLTVVDGSGTLRLCRLGAMQELKCVIRSPLLLKELLATPNMPVTHEELGNVGLLKLPTPRATKAVLLAVRGLYEEALASEIARGSLSRSTRKLKLYIAVRRDSYPTVGETDGFQTMRAIAVPSEVMDKVQTDPEYLRGLKVAVAYQADRLEHLRQMAICLASDDEAMRQCVAVLELELAADFFCD